MGNTRPVNPGMGLREMATQAAVLQKMRDRKQIENGTEEGLRTGDSGRVLGWLELDRLVNYPKMVDQGEQWLLAAD